jgi:putative membrane protein
MSAIRKGGVLLTGAAMVALMGGAAMAQKSDDATNFNGQANKTASDSRFAMKAASGGTAEVQMGQLAVQKASNEQVKQFGQRMIDDHTKAGNELQSIASKDNISLPTGLNPHDKAVYDNLSKLSGPAFDRAYMRDMVKDHLNDVNEFQREANSGSNTDLKSFATTTLPTLQEHLRIARETNSSLNARSSR